MDLRRTVRMWFVILLTSAFAVAAQTGTPEASAQGTDALLLDDVSIIVQGENDVIVGSESDNDFYALKILAFSLPYDSTKVYTKVPVSARGINVWASSVVIDSTGYGFETSGEHAGDFFVTVPSNHLRTENMVNSIDTEEEFSASGSEFSNTSYSDGALRLVDGLDIGSYMSPEIKLGEANAITSAALTVFSNSSANITSYMSNDGGGSWSSCLNDTRLNFTSTGTSLRVMFDLEGNASAGFEPWISSFRVNATYVLNRTAFTVHISYSWTEDFLEGEASLDLSEAVDLAPGGSCLLMLYLSPGYEIGSSGLLFTHDENGSSSYPGKDFYYNSDGAAQLQSLEIVLLAPEDEGNILYYVAAIALVVAFGLAVVYSRRSRSRKSTDEFEKADAQSAEEPGSVGEAEPEDMESKLATIARLDDDFEKGRLPEATYKRLRKEYVSRAARTISGQAEDASPIDAEKRKLMEAIAALDEERERGEIDEKVYVELRSSYRKQLVELMERSERETNEVR